MQSQHAPRNDIRSPDARVKKQGALCLVPDSTCGRFSTDALGALPRAYRLVTKGYPCTRPRHPTYLSIMRFFFAASTLLHNEKLVYLY